MVSCTIKREGKDKHFPENKYWEYNPNTSYLGSLVLNVNDNEEMFDLGLWISGDGDSCSMVFLQDDDHTAYHSMPAYRDKKRFYNDSLVVGDHPIQVIHRRIIELATEQGLLGKFINV